MFSAIYLCEIFDKYRDRIGIWSFKFYLYYMMADSLTLSIHRGLNWIVVL